VPAEPLQTAIAGLQEPTGAPRPWHARRLAVLGVLLTIVTALLLARPIHGGLLSVIGMAEELIRQRAAWGMVAFVVLAAVSAMFAFVSSAFLIPVAVYAWGPGTSFLLLWAGWYLGGIAAYVVGRYLGRPAVEALVRPRLLARYEAWAHSGVSLLPILLLQLAVPSDVAGYLFGLVRCRLSLFLAALAIAEVPYALGAVYLGQSFLEGRALVFVGVGITGALLMYWALRMFRRLNEERLQSQAVAECAATGEGPRGPEQQG
jgi:uncharacterized membrane protein YdjX (TVP38/TMEM64 family)